MEGSEVSSLDEQGYMVSINVGTLAIIILVVTTSCSLLTLLFLYCWRRFGSETNLSCDRCHQLIAVRDVPRPPQVVQQYFVVQPSAQQGPTTYIQPPNNFQPSLAALPGSRQHHQQQQQQHQQQQRYQQAGEIQHQYENVPEIVIEQPQPQQISFGDSATFQRLGMRAERADQSQMTEVSDSALALETRALSLVQSSPPDQTSPGLEPLTPSPVSFTPPRGQLGQVKVVNFPTHQTPCVKTPANALKRRKSALKQAGTEGRSGRTVTVVQPHQVRPGAGQEYPVLEVSHMQGSDLTTGDLQDLVDSVQDQDRDLRELVDPGDRNHSNSTNDTKTITPCSAYKSNVETTNFFNEDENFTDRSHWEQQDEGVSLENPPIEKRNSVITGAGVSLPPNVTYRGQELSPQHVILDHQDKVNTRTASSPEILISGHDQHVTDRRSSQRESSQVYQFGDELSPSHPKLLENNPRNNSKTTTPSKIPISLTHISQKTPSQEDKEQRDVEKTPSSSGKKVSVSKIPRPESSKKRKDDKFPPRPENPTNYDNNVLKNNQDRNEEKSRHLQSSLKLMKQIENA